jgi:hypothetical protein
LNRACTILQSLKESGKLKLSPSNPNSNFLKTSTHAHLWRRWDGVRTLKLLTLAGSWPLQFTIQFSEPWHQMWLSFYSTRPAISSCTLWLFPLWAVLIVSYLLRAYSLIFIVLQSLTPAHNSYSLSCGQM